MAAVNLYGVESKQSKERKKRVTDPLTKSKGSTANILQKQGKDKKKRLDEITKLLAK